jgi:hypothetical protein
MKAPRVVTFAQPIEKIADREQHARDGYANVHEQIDENERNAAVDIHGRPQARAWCHKGDNCRSVPRLWNSKTGMSISPKTGMGR